MSDSQSSGHRTTPPATPLPVVEDCTGCGVCCFHMGYPAFMLPADPLTDAEIEADPKLRQLASRDADMREHLKRGHPGESHWHALPSHLKRELQEFLEGYEPPEGELEGPCIWFDMQTRRCLHHQWRPRVCRDFRAGSVACRRWRKVYRNEILPNPESDTGATE